MQISLLARMGKEIIEMMFEQGERRDPAEVVREKGWYTETNIAALEAMCREIFDSHPDEVLFYL